MAWTMSVRPRGERASSVFRRLITSGIDPTIASLLGARSVLHGSQLVLQITLLIAALAHLGSAPILAVLAIIGALTWFASAAWSARQATVVNVPAQCSDDVAPAADTAPSTAAGSPLQAVAAQGFPNSIYRPFNAIAPANDAHAWAGLCARLSHELRTPLNAVLGFSELMKAELHGPLGRPRYREYVTHIRESGRALLKSTEDTLAITELLSGSHNGSPAVARALAVEPLLADAWHFLQPFALARSIHFELDVPAELEVLGDHRALRQAIINLLEEAICHAADGGVVRVTAVSARCFVDLDISAESRNAERLSDTLSIHLARALLEISGARLAIRTDHGKWQARTLLDRAIQPDFFERLGTKAAAG